MKPLIVIDPASYDRGTAPRPATTAAVLGSGGYHRLVPTRHFWKETRLVKTANGELAWEHLFKCFRTGAVRRWGLDRVEEDDAKFLRTSGLFAVVN